MADVTELCTAGVAAPRYLLSMKNTVRTTTIHTITLLTTALIAISGAFFAGSANAAVDAFAKGSHFFLLTNKGETAYYYEVVYSAKNDPNNVYHNWEGYLSAFKGRQLGAWTGGTADDQIDVYLSKDYIGLGAVQSRTVGQRIVYHYTIDGNSNICFLDRFLRKATVDFSTADSGGASPCTAY
ncbi:hypothetical protein [Williamsia sp. CHRR-6]|uniref:hypothetical protein n=1 Tax=Williamsia sp. CHRR-6 TaxID=2835871 RepID=UPI001BDA5CE1|nr:hypothetical protein [Williamsia sp. CHRR-6]MBT0566964.1 hypothetical protein [Williamsia sp. CHRR-6]